MSELGHKNLECVFEHGEDWQICLDCGALWALVGGDADTELVDYGDGSCEEGEQGSESNSNKAWREFEAEAFKTKG